MKKIPVKYAPFLTSLILSLLMAFLMSGIITALNVGVGKDFISIWLHAFIKVWPIAFILLLLLRPVVMKIVKWLTD